MRVCMYVCMQVCMYVYVCMYVCVRVYVYFYGNGFPIMCAVAHGHYPIDKSPKYCQPECFCNGAHTRCDTMKSTWIQTK